MIMVPPVPPAPVEATAPPAPPTATVAGPVALPPLPAVTPVCDPPGPLLAETMPPVVKSSPADRLIVPPLAPAPVPASMPPAPPLVIPVPPAPATAVLAPPGSPSGGDIAANGDVAVHAGNGYLSGKYANGSSCSGYANRATTAANSLVWFGHGGCGIAAFSSLASLRSACAFQGGDVASYHHIAGLRADAYNSALSTVSANTNASSLATFSDAVYADTGHTVIITACGAIGLNVTVNGYGAKHGADAYATTTATGTGIANGATGSACAVGRAANAAVPVHIADSAGYGVKLLRGNGATTGFQVDNATTAGVAIVAASPAVSAGCTTGATIASGTIVGADRATIGL